ncbi:hypothetical protein [Gracilibacillus alcaliphilus]|uniref:hypothetical protein n=1 Tax=Gracilibacillus alcaliphilus TaxID=1401441 RepID=UPI00195A3415|nr:hypothetical protein [Gracilibacillus alcaliphilus]MBM7676844.1 energy-coupling factor transport system substrate-specific component [Gracilibacillus alcaliphilus]
MKNRNTGLLIFLIPIGVAVNFVGGQIAVLLKLPLFLDTIGTFTIGAIAGPFAGVIVGLLTCLSISITNPQSLFYVINFMLMGFLAGYLGKKGFFTSIKKTLGAGAIMGMIVGISGSLISYFLFNGFGVSGTGVLGGILMGAGVPVWASAFISNMSVDIIDKVPTAMVAYLIIRNIPQKTLVKLPNGNVFLNAYKK